MTTLEARPRPVREGPSGRLRPRIDPHLPERLAASADAHAGLGHGPVDVGRWMSDRTAAHDYRVRKIPFADLDGWDFDGTTGNLGHHTGKFFTVEGLRARWDGVTGAVWHQPIIHQPEVGILGILAREIDGVLHFLMQSKMEPGNPNLVQLSPTVQATRSNYTRVHQGAPVRYLEYFVDQGRGTVIADVLQSEHGAWFFHKRNRNMIIEIPADEEVEVGEDFCWLTLGQLHGLLREDFMLNMDARTVLSCMPEPAPGSPDGPNDFARAVAASRDPDAGALRPTAELMSWFTDQRSRCTLEVNRVPLYDIPGWSRGEAEIRREDGRFFRVVAVAVEAASREVTGWSQPLFEPYGEGVSAFIVQEFEGVLHVLVHARAEGGFRDSVELGPTVQCVPWNHGSETAPPFLDRIPQGPDASIRYEARHSEEGGRFLDATARYLIVEADGSTPEELPSGYAWMTVGQLGELVRHGHYLNVQARTLLACLNSIR